MNTELEHIILHTISSLRHEFIKKANGASAMLFEEAVHNTFPWATSWISVDEETPWD